MKTARIELAVALLIFGRMAAADEPSTGIVADRMRPALGPATLGAAEGAETTRYGQVGTLLALGYVRDPIALRTANGEVISRPVTGQLTGTLGWEIGLPRRFALRVSLPIIMWNTGDRLRGTGADPSAGNDPGASLRAGAGDMMVGVKVALLGAASQPGLHAALALEGTVPMGGQRDFAATAGPTLAPRLFVDYRLPWLSLVLDVAARFAPERSLYTSRYGDEIVLAGGLIARFASLGAARRWHLLAYAEGEGAIAVGAGARPGELRGALRISREAGLELDVGGGAGLVDAVGAPRYRLFVLARLPLGTAR